MSTLDAIMGHAHLLTRADVVAKRNGNVECKEFGDFIGSVRRDFNASGQELWRAGAGDVSSWRWTRAEAVSLVVELHNMQEKSRLFDLLNMANRRAA